MEAQKKARWRAYQTAWKKKLAPDAVAEPEIPLVAGGKMIEVGKVQVEKFYAEYATAGAFGDYKPALAKVLKTERVR